MSRPTRDKPRESAARRGYGRRWQRARGAYLAEHPLCIACQREGRIVAATVVDHIDPHKGDMVKFWDPDNWQPLCKAHHDAKTAIEDGGFGRARGKIDEGVGPDGCPIDAAHHWNA